METMNKTTRPATTQGASDAEGKGRGEAHCMNSSPAYAGTPGAIYADTYLPGIDALLDGAFLVESINLGEIHACPRCHFLSLPQRPFPLGPAQVKRAEASGYSLPADACDICAFLPDAYLLQMAVPDLAAEMDAAAAALENARLERATTLLRLHMEQADGAQALLWAMMAEAREDARRLGATPQSE